MKWGSKNSAPTYRVWKKRRNASYVWIIQYVRKTRSRSLVQPDYFVERLKGVIAAYLNERNVAVGESVLRPHAD